MKNPQKHLIAIPAISIFIVMLWQFLNWTPAGNVELKTNALLLTPDKMQWMKSANKPDAHAKEMFSSKTVSLPHSTRQDSATYTLVFDHQFDHQILGIYIKKRRWNISVKINDHLIGSADDKSFLNPNWLTPAYFNFPASLLTEKDNLLEIQVSGIPGSTHLGHIFIGPDSELKPRYDWRYFKKVTLQHLVSVLIWLFCISAFFLWLYQQKQTFFLWFSVTTFFWALHNSVKPVPIPFYLDHTTWRILMNGSLLWFVFSGFVFSLEVSERAKFKQLKRAVAFAVTSLVFSGYLYITLFAVEFYAHFVRFIFMPFVFITGFFCAAQAVKNYLDSKRFGLLAIATLTISFVGTHDIAIVMGYIRGDYLLQYSAPILLAIFMFELVTRFIHTVRQQEIIHKTLGVEQNSEIGTGQKIDWQNLIELDRADTISKEQQAFRRELHDGISGPLISVITALQEKHAEPEKLLVPLKQCMSELRNLIETDDNGSTDLNTLLANFRHYVRPQLELLGLKLAWQVMELEDDIELETPRARHLFRILQEVMTNILKHANARHIEFYALSCRDVDGSTRIILQISDDGQGFATPTSGGHGLDNIKSRASEMGAEIEFADATGTQVFVRFCVA